MVIGRGAGVYEVSLDGGRIVIEVTVEEVQSPIN